MPEIISDPDTEIAPFPTATPPARPPEPNPPAAPEPAADNEPVPPEPTRAARIPHWRKGPTLDLATTDDDPDNEPPDDEGQPEDQEAEPQTPGHRHPRGTGKRPAYREPHPPLRQALRQAPVEWWRTMPARNKWALYNGTAVACGWALHAPQWVTAETAYLVTTYHSWTDIHVYTWYCIAALAWAVDYQARGWHWLLALPARIPLASIVVGVLLYGTPNP